MTSRLNDTEEYKSDLVDRIMEITKLEIQIESKIKKKKARYEIYEII